jgi:replicative DNA helicase
MSLLTDPSIARQFDRLPPHDLDAEMCVIASLMLCGDDRDLFTLTRSSLRTEMFYQADHQVIFDALVRMAERGCAIDAVLLRAELERAQLLDEVGGTAYLRRILESIPSAAHGPHYAQVVREKSILRGVIASANEALRRCYAPANGTDSAASIARDFLDRMAELCRTGSVAKFRRIGDVLMEVLDRKLAGDNHRIPTGLAELDRLCGGVPVGRFTLVGGRPGMGKSQTAKQIVLNVAARGVNCGIVTIEENCHKVTENALSNLSGIENNKIAFGTLGSEEWDEIGKAEPKLRGLGVWIDDVPVTLAEVEEAVMSAVMKHHCRLVVVDYLQLVDPGAGETENREITRVSRSLKGLAKRLDVALVAVCQLNRGNESAGIRRPTLRDLRGSGSLEQDGDLIVLLHREDYYRYAEPQYIPTHQLEAIVAKNKDGCLGVVPLYFSGKTQRVSDWA